MKHRNSLSDRHNLKVTSTQSHIQFHTFGDTFALMETAYFIFSQLTHILIHHVLLCSSLLFRIFLLSSWYKEDVSKTAEEHLHRLFLVIPEQKSGFTVLLAEILSTHTEVFHCPQLFFGN